MMRHAVIVGLVLCLVAAAPAALIIDKVQIEQTSGASAAYTYVDGNLQWSGGAFSYIYTEGGNFFSFDSASINANFDLASDDSAGGVAKARFDLFGSWSVSLYKAGYTGAVVIITGTMNNGGGFGSKYWEAETGYERLDGKAWVNIGSFWADATWVANEVLPVSFDGLTWDEDLIAGLDSDVSLNAGTGDINSYGQNYNSDNGLTLTLFSDQSQVIPEPATMMLLGLGAVLLRKKK
jgi:hypothetical protein